MLPNGKKENYKKIHLCHLLGKETLNLQFTLNIR